MKLRIENTSTKVARATDEEADWLYAFLSFEDDKAEARRRAGYHVGDDRVRMFDRRRYTFPTGLLPIVIEGAGKKHIPLHIEDGREPAEPARFRPREEMEAWPWNMKAEWSFQYEALCAAYMGGLPKPEPSRVHLDGRGIVKSPTGSGKGNIAAALAYAIEGRWLFVVHRGHLADDVRTRWNEMAGACGEPEAGFIGDGEWTVGERLTCATLQTLHAAKKRGDPRYHDLAKLVTGLIIDECHTAPAKSFYRTIQGMKRARYRIGLSGTPLDRGDRRSLLAIAAIGPLIYSIKARDLIDAGVLAEPHITVIPVAQRASERARGDWHRTYNELVVESAHRNGALLAAMERALKDGDTPGMVFVRRIPHGQELANLARKRGLNVAYVDGSKDTSQRRKAVEDLGNGRLDFVVATKVFTEGVNVPELRCVINGAGGKSVIEALQQVGRGTRTTSTKTSFRVYEIGDKGERMLHDHARERLRAYRREGYAVGVDREIWPERAGT